MTSLWLIDMCVKRITDDKIADIQKGKRKKCKTMLSADTLEKALVDVKDIMKNNNLEIIYFVSVIRANEIMIHAMHEVFSDITSIMEKDKDS